MDLFPNWLFGHRPPKREYKHSMKIPTECFRRQIWRSENKFIPHNNFTTSVSMLSFSIIVDTSLPCAQTSKSLKKLGFLWTWARGEIVLTLGWIFKIELSMKLQPRKVTPSANCIMLLCIPILSKASLCMAKQSCSSQSGVFWILCIDV